MSEKRNRKSNQNKEPRRPIILAKKSDDKVTVEKPRILLKPKESKAAPQISIASRPVQEASHGDSAKSSRLQPPSKDPQPSTSNENVCIEPRMPSMDKPCPIISDHYQIQSAAQDFLIETNTDFTVVGVIGTQGAGKSFILNMLIDDEADNDQVDNLIRGRTGVFAMRNQNSILSNMPATEGIQMYITRHRIILLDCSPVLCNPYKKEAIFNELDDLRMLIFLLSVCNSLIVVEDSGFNMHLMRLLLTADSMKVDVYENDCSDNRHSPNIMLFKNKCQNHDFLDETKQRTGHLYRAIVECSNLRATNSMRHFDKRSSDDHMNVFLFPWIDTNSKNHFQAYPDIEILLTEFRQRIFMSSRTPFPVPRQQTTAFTEKNWFQMALAVWESHKTNYFLRKYESLKEKEWALRV